MAVFPQGKTRIRERVRGGERRVFEALARQLEDDYTVWHNIPILGSSREPDFVILHPQRGLLILEVKDWKLARILDANPMRVHLRAARDVAPSRPGNISPIRHELPRTCGRHRTALANGRSHRPRSSRGDGRRKRARRCVMAGLSVR